MPSPGIIRSEYIPMFYTPSFNTLFIPIWVTAYYIPSVNMPCIYQYNVLHSLYRVSFNSPVYYKVQKQIYKGIYHMFYTPHFNTPFLRIPIWVTVHYIPSVNMPCIYQCNVLQTPYIVSFNSPVYYKVQKQIYEDFYHTGIWT